MARRTIDETIEMLKKQLEEWGVAYDRQHGKAGEVKLDINEEKIRLRNNLASQVARYKKRMRDKEIDARINKFENDKDGINQVDERRFKQCFVYENIAPEMRYVKIMTGLNEIQIGILEKRFKMYCDHSL